MTQTTINNQLTKYSWKGKGENTKTRGRNFLILSSRCCRRLLTISEESDTSGLDNAAILVHLCRQQHDYPPFSHPPFLLEKVFFLKITTED